jgi:hypothetical protein
MSASSYNVSLDLDEATVYDDTLHSAAEMLGRDGDTEVRYSVSIEGADASDLHTDIERIEIVGGEYDGVDGTGRPFYDDGGTRRYLETRDVGSFDQGAMTGSTKTGPHQYRLSTTSGDLEVAEDASGSSVICSGDVFDEAVLEGEGDYAFQARILDDTGTVLDESSWQAPDYETVDTDDVADAYDETKNALDDFNNMRWGSLIRRLL